MAISLGILTQHFQTYPYEQIFKNPVVSESFFVMSHFFHRTWSRSPADRWSRWPCGSSFHSDAFWENHLGAKAPPQHYEHLVFRRLPDGYVDYVDSSPGRMVLVEQIIQVLVLFVLIRNKAFTLVHHFDTL